MSAFSVNSRLTQADDLTWNLLFDIDKGKAPKSINGKRFEIPIDMTGKGGTAGSGVVIVTVRIGK